MKCGIIKIGQMKLKEVKLHFKQLWLLDMMKIKNYMLTLMLKSCN